jgi:hypothetical protein
VCQVKASENILSLASVQGVGAKWPPESGKACRARTGDRLGLLDPGQEELTELQCKWAEMSPRHGRSQEGQPGELAVIHQRQEENDHALEQLTTQEL